MTDVVIDSEFEWVQLDSTPRQCERVPTPCSSDACVSVTLTCMGCNKSETRAACWPCASRLMNMRRGVCRTYQRSAAIFINSVDPL